jgi:hypothetical protein
VLKIVKNPAMAVNNHEIMTNPIAPASWLTDKTTKSSEPAVSRRKSPNQRGYEDVQSREYLFPCLVKTEK